MTDHQYVEDLARSVAETVVGALDDPTRRLDVEWLLEDKLAEAHALYQTAFAPGDESWDPEVTHWARWHKWLFESALATLRGEPLPAAPDRPPPPRPEPSP